MKAQALLCAAVLAAGVGCNPEPYCLNCTTGGSIVPTGDGSVTPRDGSTDTGGITGDRGPCVPTGMETCDGRDNNCNGAVDEGFDTQTDARNCGMCGHTCEPAGAIPVCVAGRCQIRQCDVGHYDLNMNPDDGCEYACTPTGDRESCDGVDNNCDGNVDEGFDLMSNAANCGRCGTVCTFSGADGACVMGTCRIAGCRAGFIDRDRDPSNGCEYACAPTGPEVCDGRDNDCDGTVDNGINLMTDAMNCGACGRTCPVVNNTPTCVAGRCAVGTCAAGFANLNGDATDGCEWACGGTGGAVGPEVCNGRDDNCDGRIDDVYPEMGRSCGATMGMCRPGMSVCERGTLRCVGGTQAIPELCNGLDDDCDGTVDNPPPGGVLPGTGPTTICGTNVGVCTFGRFACVSGGLQCQGGTTATGTSGAEALCDGLDNNCNGMIDEGVTVPAGFRCNRRGSETTGVCGTARPFCNGRMGYQCTFPTTYRDLDSEAYCDGLDNNCDGRIDEGCLSLFPSTDVRLDRSTTNTIQPMITGGGTNLGVVYIDRRSMYVQRYPDGTTETFNAADIFFTRSVNGGATWAADVRLDTDAAGSRDSVQPVLSWPGGGAASTVLWGDFRGGNYRQVFANYSATSGASWSAADARVNRAQENDSFNLKLEQATAGFVAVYEALFSDRSRHIFITTSTNGATWSAPRQVDTGPMTAIASTPDLAVAGNRVFIVWRDNRSGASTDIYFRGSADGGATFAGADVRLDTDMAGAHASEEPTVAADATGNVTVAWQDVRDARAYDIYANRSTNNGTSWLAADVRVDTDPYQHDSVHPTAMALGDGNAAVVWQELRWGLPNVYASRTTATGFLANDVKVMAGLPGQSRAFNVAASASGSAVFAVWSDDRNGSLDIYANYSLDGGATFQPADVRLDSATGRTDSATPSVFALGNVGHVVWVDRRGDGINGDIYYRSLRAP